MLVLYTLMGHLICFMQDMLRYNYISELLLQTFTFFFFNGLKLNLCSTFSYFASSFKVVGVPRSDNIFYLILDVFWLQYKLKVVYK